MSKDVDADEAFSTEAGTSGAVLRKKYEEVSKAFEKYNALLLEQRQLHELLKPDSSFVDSMYNFITSEKAEHPHWLEHPENTVYAVWDDDREPIQGDLVTLNPEFKNQDPFTHFITTQELDWWHTIFHRSQKADDQEFDVCVYASKSPSSLMGAVTLLIASALPTSSIIALYFIRSEVWRLIFIVLLAGLFAGPLGVFTEARRTDVFAASAALASVQVVFVGRAFGNGNQNHG
ncbi:hypothetical protein LTR86_003098 [Recurvomyces mirabilis]|nr:hypothetical protein LTR86_003098 [Recurvomyces mirabilis]